MKSKISNIVMVIAILIIAFSGVMMVGNVKGWFDDTNEGNEFIISDKMGNSSIERSGISYSLQKDTVLKNGDVIETLANSTLQIKSKHTTIVLNENTKLTVASCDEKSVLLQLEKGEIFVAETKLASDESFQVSFAGKNANITDSETVCSIDVEDGTQNVNVLAGSVKASDEKATELAESGQCIAVIDDESDDSNFTVSSLSITALDDFVLQQALNISDSVTLAFTKDDIKSVLEGRKAEKEQAQEDILTLEEEESEKKDTTESPNASKEAMQKEEASQDSESSENITNSNESNSDSSSQDTKSSSNDTKKNSDTSSAGNSNQSSSSQKQDSSGDKSKDTSKKTDSANNNSSESSSNPSTTENSNSSESGDDSDKAVYTCTLSIRCDTILNNMNNLKSGKSAYVPSDGCILATTKVEFTDGETVYDVLKRACDRLDIQLEASYTPIYKSYYVEGIHNLYEFDCGTQSGWMYKVNGWYPNYGCSSYKLKDGDAIVWNYTCDGLGEDIS